MAIKISNTTVIDDSRNLTNIANVSAVGVSTFASSSTILIGSATSTGSADQKLQVTGHGYVSGSVGIGTTNPTVKLDVVGGSMRIVATGYPAATYGTNVGRIQFGYQDAFDGAELSAATNAGAGKKLYLNATGNGPVLINTFTETGTASQALQVGTLLAPLGAFISGNVGIGTTNPVDKLHVTDSAGEVATFESTTTEVALRLKNSTAGNVYLFNKDSNNFAIRCGGAAGSETLRVTSTSVGIGTTNPVGQLQVSSGPVIIGAASSTGTASQPLQVTGGAYFSGAVGVGTTLPLIAGSNHGGFTISGSDTARLYFEDTGYEVTGSGVGQFIYDNGNLAWFTGNRNGSTTSGSSELFRVLENGNLGIGTTNPSVKLQVSGGDLTLDRGGVTNTLTRNLTIGGARNNAGVGGFAAINLSNYDGNASAVEYNAVRLVGIQPLVPNNGGQLAIYTTPNGSTTSVERVRVFDTGEVGINTTVVTGTASQPLQVSGGAYVSGNLGIGTTNPNGILQVGAASTQAFVVNSVGQLILGATSANNDSPIIIKSVGAAATPAPQILLSPTLGTNQSVIQFSNNGSASFFIGRSNSIGTVTSTSGGIAISGLNNGSYAEVIGNSGTLPLLFLTNSIEAMRINSSQQVGIGTTNPNGILQVGAASTQAFTIFSTGEVIIGGITTVNSNRIPLTVTGAGIGSTNPNVLISPTTGTNAAHIAFFNGGSGSMYLGRTNSAGKTAVFDLATTGYIDFVGNSGTLPLLFLTNSIEAMRINSSQQVGIGTTNPTATLTIGTVGVASDGKSQIYLNGTTSNRIDFAQTGVAGPAIIGTSGTTRSVGTKIVLNPGSAAAADYAFGIQSNTLWSSVPSSSQSYLWYAGTVGIATLSGTGDLSLSGGLTLGAGGDITADFSNATLTSRSYFITNTTNGSTVVGAIPNGTNATTGFLAFNNSTPTNATYCGVVAGATGGFLRVATTGTGAYLPLNIETNNVTQVAISTGGEVTFTKGITVSAGIATIPTVSVTATTASTTTATGALTVGGGVGIAASVNAGGDVKSRRDSYDNVTVTMSGTPANIATIVATGNVGLVTFATTGIAATVNVTGMIAGQVLNLFVSNPTTSKVLTIQYNGTAIPGPGIASASSAQGVAIGISATKWYTFMATGTTSAAPVVGDIRVTSV